MAAGERIVGKSGCTVEQAKAKFSTEHYSPIRHKAEMEHLRATLARVTPPPPAAADPAVWSCATCTTTGRHGYCAPTRCYCGHPTCHAFESWIDLRKETK